MLKAAIAQAGIIQVQQDKRPNPNGAMHCKNACSHSKKPSQKKTSRSGLGRKQVVGSVCISEPGTPAGIGKVAQGSGGREGGEGGGAGGQANQGQEGAVAVAMAHTDIQMLFPTSNTHTPSLHRHLPAL